MTLGSPMALILCVFLPVIWEPKYRARLMELLGKGAKYQSASLRLASPLPFSELVNLSIKTRFRDPLLSLIRSAAFLLLVFALARPQSVSEIVESEASGRDIMIVLDISGSMQALDFSLNGQRVDRLKALKTVVNEFIDARAGDRMGLIVFADEAFTQCPLTLDTGILKEFVSALEVGMAGQGTAIGDGLSIALKRMRDIEAKSRVVVLVTDGKNNSGAVSPVEAARIAAKLDVKVHVIGIGGEGSALFPMKTPFGSTRYIEREMEYDEKTLKEIADTTGGIYFNAKNTDALREIYNRISALEERHEKTKLYIEHEERFVPFILIGLVLLACAEFLASTVLLKVP